MPAYPTSPPNVFLSSSRRGLVRYSPPQGSEALSSSAEVVVPLRRSNRLSGLPIAGNDIPDDVWRLIAFHIATTMKIQYMLPLMAVNRSFFEFILDLKYREVQWHNVDADFVKTLRRLQHPIISRRVRRLSVRVDALDDLFAPQSSLKKLLSYPGALTRKNLSQEAILRWFMTAANGMTGMIKFDADMRHPPKNKDTFIFLKLIRTAFNNNLHSLVLRAQLPTFNLLLPIGYCKHLDELNFNFNSALAEDHPSAHEGSKEDAHARALTETVILHF